MPDRTEWAIIANAIAAVIDIGFIWRYALSRSGQARLKNPHLPEWRATAVDFLTLLFFVVGCWFLSVYASTLALRNAGLGDDHTVTLQSVIAEAGMLVGVITFALVFPEQFDLPKLDLKKTILSGIVTYFIAIPVVLLTGVIWVNLLKLVRLPVQEQPAIELFGRTKNLGWLSLLIVLAVVLAPMAEEFIFRVGFFRFLRTRAPRWLALLGPACLFAALHQNLASFGQLVALAIVFSYAYEQTGQVGTSMVAHALFNLTTVVQLLLGINL